MNAQERLHAAHLAALEGKYAEALSEYIWFHHHALSEQPSLYGVRLSFALAHWKELADVYPPALVALLEIRDNKTTRLAAGEFDRELFHDVDAINQYLGAGSETACLFALLDRNAPDIARECGDLAFEALVEAGKFTLAAKYLPEPLARVTTLAERLNCDIARIPERPRSKSPRWLFRWKLSLMVIGAAGLTLLVSGMAILQRRKWGLLTISAAALCVAAFPWILSVTAGTRYQFETAGLLETAILLGVAAIAAAGYFWSGRSDAA